MIPPPHPDSRIRNLTLVVHCKKCGHGKILASGYNAAGMTTERKLEILKVIGWVVIPMILCRSCACPMEVMEMQEAKKLREGGKMIAWLKFRTAMQQKYKSPAVARWFETMYLHD